MSGVLTNLGRGGGNERVGVSLRDPRTSRTTNRGLESGLACHPCLCHGRAAPRARRNYPLVFGFAPLARAGERERERRVDCG